MKLLHLMKIAKGSLQASQASPKCEFLHQVAPQTITTTCSPKRILSQPLQRGIVHSLKSALQTLSKP